MNAEALSLAAGLSKSIVSNLEARVGVPRLPTVERLANALRLSPCFLAFGIESPWEPAEVLRCEGLAARAGDARTTRGFTLREVGRRAGSSAAAIRTVESGTMPTLDTIELLAQALDVSPSWLAFGIGPREAPPRRGAYQVAQAAD